VTAELFHFTAVALPDIPLIQPGDDLAAIILKAVSAAGMTLQLDDVLVISSKIVSKAEGRFVRLSDVIPGEKALQVAIETGKDPRVVELVLQESTGVSRKSRNLLVTQHRLGFTSANGGIDASNVDGGESVLLLPLDPDISAQRIRSALHDLTGVETAVIISDTHGRPFRMGNVGVAIGVAGMQAVIDLRGQPDLFGRKMEVSTEGYADLVASAAHLLCGEADEGRPVIHLRGLQFPKGDGHASDLNRPPEQDLYR
jgi:coenzyme F420-0:L-glutamate ligase / coenzyme F420-1:gamma-L-glutamate ligase